MINTLFNIFLGVALVCGIAVAIVVAAALIIVFICDIKEMIKDLKIKRRRNGKTD